jgi:putative SOS response-associated peptidase YedK
MCYDLSFKTSLQSIHDIFPGLIQDDQFQIHPDKSAHIVAHSFEEHPIVMRNREDGLLHLKLMEWGCIPFYTKDESAFMKQRIMMLNARSERILGDSTSYWFKIRNRRCLIPVTGIFEHRKVTGLTKKVPYFIYQKTNKIDLLNPNPQTLSTESSNPNPQILSTQHIQPAPFFLPGLYSVAELPNLQTGELEKRWTFTLITRAANSLMQQIHNDGENKWRMPLFLPVDLRNQWMEPELSTDALQSILNYELPADELDCWPVYTIRSSKPRPDGLSKTDPFVWEGLPALEI